MMMMDFPTFDSQHSISDTELRLLGL